MAFEERVLLFGHPSSCVFDEDADGSVHDRFRILGELVCDLERPDDFVVVTELHEM